MKHDLTTGTWQDDTGCPISIILVSISDVIHPNRTRPDPLLRATKSAASVQSVGQKLESDLLPLLGRRARWQLEVRRYTLPCSAATKYSCADKRRFCRGPACPRARATERHASASYPCIRGREGTCQACQEQHTM
jgi:hypothetical protein